MTDQDTFLNTAYKVLIYIEFFYSESTMLFLEDKSFYHTSIPLFKNQKYSICYLIEKTQQLNI